MTDDDRPSVELAWTPELADYVDGYRARDRADRALRVFILLGAAVVVACVAAALSGDPDYLPFAAGATAGLLAVPIVTRVAVRRLWRNGLAERGPTRARVEPGVGISMVTRGSSARTEWTHLTRVLETRRSFVLPVGRQRGAFVIVLPKRALADQRDVDRLRAILEHETRAARDGVVLTGVTPATGTGPHAASGAASGAAPDAVVLRWRPVVEDYVEAFEARRRARRARRLPVMLGALGLIALGAWVTRDTVAVVLLVAFTAVVVLERSLMRRSVRRSWAREPALRQDRVARVSAEEGLVVELGASAGRYGWERLARVVETERSFVLLGDAAWTTTFWLLAKRGATPEDVERLRRLLAEHVGRSPADHDHRRVGQVGLEPTTDGL